MKPPPDDPEFRRFTEAMREPGGPFKPSFGLSGVLECSTASSAEHDAFSAEPRHPRPAWINLAHPVSLSAEP